MPREISWILDRRFQSRRDVGELIAEVVLLGEEGSPAPNAMRIRARRAAAAPRRGGPAGSGVVPRPRLRQFFCATPSCASLAFPIDVATSSLNFSRRSPASGGSLLVSQAVIAPHRRPSTKIGLATIETTPARRATSATGPPADQSISSMRTERCVRRTRATGKIVGIPSRSGLDRVAASDANDHEVCVVGVGLEPADGGHGRTQHASDFIADCREDRRRLRALRDQRRDPAQRRLLIGKQRECVARVGVHYLLAVMRPANCAIRDSISAGNTSFWLVTATMVPHRRPWTTTGAATAERTPNPLAMAATEPLEPAKSSTRAACPVKTPRR